MSGEREPLLRHAGTSGRSRGYRSAMSPIERNGDDIEFTEISVPERFNMKQYVKKCCTLEAVKGKLPITKWLPKYSLTDLQCDVISGLTVALTVLPQGLAYAIIADLPQQYGLYSAFMGVFVYTILGTSKDITLGPTAIMSLMTAAFASSPVKDDPTYAVVLCLFCGSVQLLMGILHLGILVNFISYPVINAFTSAAAITIACGQVKGILGLKDIPREFLHMVYETCKKIPETRVWDLTMGLICLIILFLLKQMRKKKWKPNPHNVPLTLCQKIIRKIVWLVGIGANAIVVITSAGVVAILHYYGYTSEITTTGYVKPGLPPFKFPSFSVQNGNSTIGGGDIISDIGTGLFIVPILGLVESIAIGKAFARQNNYRIDPNQELLAIGVANVASSFVSAYPVTGSFSRTAVNSQSGVRTPMSGVFTGGVILLSLAFLTPLFKFIPKSALSAVIISAVIQMVDYEILPKFWNIQKMSLIPWVITFLTSFGLGIEYGILIGIGVQLLLLLYPVARPKITVDYLDYVVVTFNQAIRFPSVEYLQTRILKHMYSEDEKPRSVILDCNHLASGLDYTTIMGLIEVIADFKKKGVHFSMASVHPEIKKELDHANVVVIYGDSVADSIRRIKEKEKAGEMDDEIESITVTNGKFQANAINGTPIPNVPEVNYGYSKGPNEGDSDSDSEDGVRL
ncbi:sodium-independent sulfate anion transporter-like isoform X2 [Ruditapes philippinarum]|uniref:sodium-independent sulfate anion transporter-like isoform X2 n=1 Tax=Ruditapes philippinarum TaxID=129788 RepID=UPI00295BCC7E|nr:sodium-independent sulfate anion transporter-like isoform X2 [Ruditapes philippinarum]